MVPFSQSAIDRTKQSQQVLFSQSAIDRTKQSQQAGLLFSQSAFPLLLIEPNEASRQAYCFHSLFVSSPACVFACGLLSIQFNSVQNGIYALGKAHIRSTPSLRSLPNVAFEAVPMFV